MHEDPSPQGKLTRRTMLAGAAAGTLALTTAPASAQRCPANPAHVKGPNVWLELDQKELDDAYDQSVYAYNQPNITDRRAANDETARPILGQPQRVAYGPSEIEKLDIYKTKRPNAPTLIFIHGGSWQNGSAARGFYIAEPYVKAGAHFIAVDFNNVREINGDLTPMVEQCRRAVGWVYRNAASFGGDPNQIYLCGHSSGGHLGGCVVITEWEKQGLPRDILKGALLGSGMYDLKAVRLSKRAAYVKFTDEMEQAFSAQRHLDKIHTPLVLTHG
ncbi:MAG: arylformamidase, partial [Alphaproteobacteria bacterium]|nr:arylformamidase [Alphaproteobacteria bacterium]